MRGGWYVAWCLGVCGALTACTEAPPPAPVAIASLPAAERVAWVSQMLAARLQPLPSALEDAQFAEFTVGGAAAADSRAIGPTDYQAFLLARVPVAAIGQWEAHFTPLDSPPAYVRPGGPYPPWVSEQAFAQLAFYAPQALSHRVRGWIGVARQTGEIYLYTSTD